MQGLCFGRRTCSPFLCSLLSEQVNKSRYVLRVWFRGLPCSSGRARELPQNRFFLTFSGRRDIIYLPCSTRAPLGVWCGVSSRRFKAAGALFLCFGELTLYNYERFSAFARSPPPASESFSPRSEGGCAFCLPLAVFCCPFIHNALQNLSPPLVLFRVGHILSPPPAVAPLNHSPNIAAVILSALVFCARSRSCRYIIVIDMFL